MTEMAVTVSSRCDECDGRLHPRARHLCDEHREARRRAKDRERAKRYRRRQQGLDEQSGATLSPEEVTRLRDLTVTLLARENEMRTWTEAQRRDSQSVPPQVLNYLAAGAKVRRALNGFIHHS